MSTRPALASALLYAWTLAWIFSRVFGDIPPGNDSAYYLVSAQGFATGQPYRDLSSPIPGAGALLGPSLFPLLLSVFYLFPHPDLVFLKGVIAAVIALAPVLAFHWMRIFLPASLAFLCALAFGANYSFIVQGNSIMTESIYCPLLYGALLLSHRALAAPQGSARHFWPSMLLWVALARTRVVGWFFLATYALLAARRRRWAAVAAGVAAAGAWIALERWLASGIQTLRYTHNVFTRQYPILVDPWLGVKALAANLRDNLWAFAGSIDAHILFPFLYELMEMNRPKRLACLLVFAWSAYGAFLAWRRHATARPWILASAAALAPTFLIFEPHDNFRYLMPLFPLLALFFLEPFRLIAEAATSPLRRHAPLLAGGLLLLAQAFGSLRHDFDTEYIDYPKDYAALHDSLLALPRRPDLCLSPDFHYTWLKTGCPSLHLQSRHGLDFLREVAPGKETWTLCGPRNDYYCEEWERQGVVFGEPRQSGAWRLRRIEKWPWDR